MLKKVRGARWKTRALRPDYWPTRVETAEVVASMRQFDEHYGRREVYVGPSFGLNVSAYQPRPLLPGGEHRPIVTAPTLAEWALRMDGDVAAVVDLLTQVDDVLDDAFIDHVYSKGSE